MGHLELSVQLAVGYLQTVSFTAKVLWVVSKKSGLWGHFSASCAAGKHLLSYVFLYFTCSTQIQLFITTMSWVGLGSDRQMTTSWWYQEH